MENMAQNILPREGDHILWIRFWALGDVLQSAAEAMLFKERFPKTHLTFLTKPLYAELLMEQPWCDDVLSGDKKPLFNFRRTLSKVKLGDFDWIISTNHGGSAAILSLLSGVRNRVGTAPLQFMYTETLRDFYARSGIDSSDRARRSIFVRESNRYSALQSLARLPDRKLMAIIGASNERKMWPLGHWRNLLTRLSHEGWGIVLVGNGEREINFAEELETSLNGENVINTVGKLSLIELSAIASACSAAVGNDTGTLHLAALSGLPTIGLSDYDQYEWLGLTMPWFIGLSASKLETRNVSSTTGRSASLLAEITPEVVLEAFHRLPDKPHTG